MYHHTMFMPFKLQHLIQSWSPVETAPCTAIVIHCKQHHMNKYLQMLYFKIYSQIQMFECTTIQCSCHLNSNVWSRASTVETAPCNARFLTHRFRCLNIFTVLHFAFMITNFTTGYNYVSFLKYEQTFGFQCLILHMYTIIVYMCNIKH